jgi:hypothetical protein
MTYSANLRSPSQNDAVPALRIVDFPDDVTQNPPS